MILYAWFFDDKDFKDHFLWFCYLPYGAKDGICIIDTNWFVIEMVLLALLIITSIKLRKKVAKSYLRTYRAVKRNKDSKESGAPKYRTLIAV